LATLTYFTVTGTFLAALKDSVYDVDNDPELTPMCGTVTFTPVINSGDSIPAGTLTPPANLFLVPVKAQLRSGVITCNGATGVKLVANTAVLGLSGNLYYRVDFYDGLTAGGRVYPADTFTFQAPTTATTVDLVTVTPLPGSPAVGDVHPVLSVAGKTGAVVLYVGDVSGAEATANKDTANGYAGLDSGGKIALSQMPVGAMEYKGIWNASTNSPTLADGTGTAGFLYRVGTAGSRNLGSGSTTFDVGDYVIHNGSTWERSRGTDDVASFLGLVQAAKSPDLLVTGAVTVDSSDLVTSAVVAWSDGSPGTLTITSRDLNSAVLAYNITYGSPVTKTFTQPTITRNTNGAATNVPAIVVT
jgi:hypothetical protein